MSFSPHDYLLLLPELMLLALGLVAIALSLMGLRNSPGALMGLLWGQITVLGFTFAWMFCLGPLNTPPVFGGLLQFNIGHLLAGLGLQIVSIYIAWMSRREGQKNFFLPLEYYGLLFSATVALMLLVKASHLIMLFVCLEASSLFVALMLFLSAPGSPGTALKYLVQTALSAVAFLWGASLLYGDTHTLEYTGLFSALAHPASAWEISGVALILSAFAFKLGLFPFGHWVVQVYQGASYPVLGFLATASKLAAAVALWGLLTHPFAALAGECQAALSVVVILTLVWAAWGALRQTDLKRLLALSGVVHAGFITAALLFSCYNINALQGVFFYFIAYISAVLLILYCLVELRIQSPTFDALKNTYHRHPGYGLLMVFAFASLAGLPPLSGFLAKFFVFFQAVRLQEWPLLASMIFAGALGLYYYLNAIFSLMGRQNDLPESPQQPQSIPVGYSTRIFAGILLMTVLLLGLVQGPFALLVK